MFANGEFDTFWAAYPRHIKRRAAERAFAKVPASVTLEMVLAGIARWKQSAQWQHKEFIPYPATWLNNRQWEDEVEPYDGAATKGEQRARETFQAASRYIQSRLGAGASGKPARAALPRITDRD